MTGPWRQRAGDLAGRVRGFFGGGGNNDGDMQRLHGESTGELVSIEERANPRNLNTDYTELMGGSVPCPSCKGSGRIPKEMEETLVALIPVNDDRLKPKRTCMWVSFGVAVCLLLGTTAIFMLVPRSIELSADRTPIELVHIISHDEKHIAFHFLNHYNISNSNYFAIRVLNSTVSVVNKWQPWSDGVIGNGGNDTSVTVSPLSRNEQLVFNNSVKVTGAASSYCQAPFASLSSFYVNMRFDITIIVEYFSHREQIQASAQQQVCCVPSGNCTTA